MTRESSPPQLPGQVAREAYNRALKTYRKSLSVKEYAKITVPATLEDVIETTNTIQERHKTSKTRRLCDALKSTKDRLERFSTLLKGALQGVMGGELLWASMNFVILIASDSAETFTKLWRYLSQLARRCLSSTFLPILLGTLYWS